MHKNYVLCQQQRFTRPLPELFEFFSNAQNLEAITPDVLRFVILTPQPILMQAGTRIEYRLSLLGIPVHWRTVISVWEPPYRFVDEQESGPFAFWRHEHAFEDEAGAVLMRDRVEYREPLGFLGVVAHHLFVAHSLRDIFAHRQKTLARVMNNAGTVA